MMCVQEIIIKTVNTLTTVVTIFAWLNLFFYIMEIVFIGAIIFSALAAFYLYKKYPKNRNIAVALFPVDRTQNRDYRMWLTVKMQ